MNASGIVIDVRAGRLDDAYRSSDIFVMMGIGEELCANTRPRSNGKRKQIGMYLAARARGLSSTLSRASIINQRILASGRRIYCDAHVDRTHETEINAVRCITNTLRAPQYSVLPWHDAINQAASGRINGRMVLEQVHYIEFPKLNRLHYISQWTSVSQGNKWKLCLESEEVPIWCVKFNVRNVEAFRRRFCIF